MEVTDIDVEHGQSLLAGMRIPMSVNLADCGIAKLEPEPQVRMFYSSAFQCNVKSNDVFEEHRQY